MIKDPYSILGVTKTATQSEIKSAYRALAKKFHPDLNPGNKQAEATFKDINSAFESVGTEEQRAKFDRGETEQQQADARQSYYKTQQNQDGGRYSQNFSEEDFFENIFRSNRSNPNAKGEDQLYHMEINFKESILGGERTITLGNGNKLQLKINPGITSGTKLRFKNQGSPGRGTGPSGDAYVEVSIKPLAGFTRDGNDIISEISVSFIEAILGAEIKVPTLDGAVMLKIPSGVSDGSRLRIKGKGVAGSKEIGNQIVVVKIVMPKNISSELQEKIRQWEGKFDYNPRGDV